MTITTRERVQQIAAEHPDWSRRRIGEAAGCCRQRVQQILGKVVPRPAPVLPIGGGLECPACRSKNFLTNTDGSRYCRKCGERWFTR